MQTPIQLDFPGIEISQATRELIETRVGDLEQRFGRIVACRVVVTRPGDRHRSGGLYDVRIHLTVPNGKEVAVSRLNQGDERNADIHFALGDAFDRARRRLQDEARRLQGKIKTKVSPAQGTIDSLDKSGDFGFIRADDGGVIYFHRNSVIGGGASQPLAVGSRVVFFQEEGDKGPQASTVKALAKHRMRAFARERR